MIFLVVLMVAVSLWVQDTRGQDTVVGNLQLEWMRYPVRSVPNMDPYVLLPGILPPGTSYGWHWPTTLQWISSERLAVIYPFDLGAAIELYDTIGYAQLHGYYYKFDTIWAPNRWYTAQARRLNNGQIGLWGCGYDKNALRAFDRQTAPYPLHFQLDTTLTLDSASFCTDTVLRRQTQARTYYREYGYENSNYAKDYVLSHDALTFSGHVCYILPHVSSASWTLILYSEDLQRKILSRQYLLPFSATIQDSMNHTSSIFIARPPYAIQNTVRGIAGRSYSVDGERVIVFFGGENLEEVRAVRLPPADLNIDYYVEDGYIVDFAISGQQLVISKVWENGVVEWQRRPINPFAFGLYSPEYGMYRVRKSRWGGWYITVYTESPTESKMISIVVRLNDYGDITGYYRQQGPHGHTITDIAEHFSDSSFYALGTREKKLVLMKFRFRPSDTTSINGGDNSTDTTVTVDERIENVPAMVYPQPVRRGEELRVMVPEKMESAAVEVYSLEGRRMDVDLLAMDPGQLRVLMRMPAGVYQVHLVGGRHVLRWLVTVIE